MFPQEWTPYGIFGYRTRWRWARITDWGWWLAVAMSLGLWAGLICAAIGIAR